VSNDSSAERLRRRNRWPALAIIAALAVVTTITWTVVLQPAAAVDNSCNLPGAAPVSSSAAATSAAATADPTETATSTPAAPATAAAPAPLGTPTDRNVLKDTRPANPGTVLLRVVNASGTAGMARTVTESLRKAGFESIRDASDDPLYPASDLRCYGQIRYGAAGAQAARTVLLVAPCATLMLDGRFDDSVEFAIGKAFTDATLTAAQTAELAQIKKDSTPPAVLEGATQAAPIQAAIPPLPSTATCPA
jgi:LytR cell envelope-related transcriptional attenuator